MTITETALALPVQERMALLESIRLSLRPDIRTRGDFLLGIMAEMFGLPAIPQDVRKANYVWARTIVAYQLRKEGYTLEEIGRQLGKDHATITHLLYKMEWALAYPTMYFETIKLYREFEKRIQDDIHNRADDDPLIF